VITCIVLSNKVDLSRSSKYNISSVRVITFKARRKILVRSQWPSSLPPPGCGHSHAPSGSSLLRWRRAATPPPPRP
jgi:hypothetical protein